MHRSTRSTLLLVVALAAGPVAADPGLGSLQGTPLGDLLERVDEARAEVRTLRAGFHEIRESELFAEVVRASGEILVQHPERILWVYEEPEKRYFLLEGHTMTAFYPERALAERQDVKRYGQRLRRMLGLGESSVDMVRSNQVSLLEQSELEGTSELLMVPRNRRIREYVAEVRLWIDDETALARQVRYREASGDQVTIGLDRVEVNPELDAQALTIPIPPDVEIREELSGFGVLDAEE